MKSPISFLQNLGRCSFLTGVAALIVAGMMTTGCNNFIKRAQSPDDDELQQFEDKSPAGPKYIAETCGMWGMDYARIEGIGLLMGLDGTGSHAKPGSYRDHLFEELNTHKDKIKHPRELFESKNTEMVVVRGYVPPGARKGDPFDVEISMVPNMDGTSLDDGTLFRTRLRPLVNFTNHRRLKEGFVLGLAEGPVLVDSVFESRQDSGNELQGWILGGGEATKDRELGLNLRTQNYGPKTTTLISRAINARFTSLTPNGRQGMAKPKNYKTITLLLPDIYQHNIKRFSQVMANVRYNETAQQRVDRLDELARQMTNPATCTQAALRLEAIGRDAVPTLKRSLTNPDMELRFRAAEALTYCGHSEGLSILKEVAEVEPAFRWHAITALATSEETDASLYLEQLTQAESAETRYGAFHALRIRNPEHPLVYGNRFPDFFMHSVPTDASSMVHFSRSKRPELVVFGDAKVSDDFLYVETGTTIRSAGRGKLKLIHYSKEHGREEVYCSTQVKDLVVALSNHDFTYGSILRILRKARKDETLLARLVVDAVPGSNRQYEDSPTPEESTHYVAEAPPELFRNGSELQEKQPKRVTTDLINGNIPTAEEIEASQSTWTRMKNLLSPQ